MFAAISVVCMSFSPVVVTSTVGQTETATSPTDIRVADGFRVELLYSVPLKEQGSWVCMTEDRQGRLICGDQRGKLYRLTLQDDNASPLVEPLPVDIGHAQGLVCAHDSLYVVVSGVAAKGPGFYRVRDTDGDDQYDEVKLLKKFELTTSSARFRSIRMRVQNMMISSGHGPHGVCLGPDGMLYIMGGNHTRIPDGVSKASPFQNWAEDLLLPRIPDAQGIATGIEAPGGWVARTDKDGKQWTLFCGGLRNAYDLAFNPDGELLTFDSDMEFDVGAMWYRPCRINHLVAGGEYGWRYGSGKWPEYNTDSVGAVVNVGFASPTGIAFGQGAKFPADYQRAMFVGDWAYGKILTVHLTPHGSSYRGSFEVFLEGKPLAVTDFIVHSDGALYFLIGGRTTQSGVYRVSYVGDQATTLVDVPSKSTADQESRRLRRKLESLSASGDNASIEFATSQLNSHDRLVRYAARLALERQPVTAWKQAALDESRVTASIQSVIALARAGDPSLQQNLLSKLNRLPFDQLTEEQLLDALRAYALVFIRLGGSENTDRESVVKPLLPMLPSQSPEVNRELCRVLVYLQAVGVVDRALQLLKASETQEEQMYYAFVLRKARLGWTIDQRKTYFGWLRLAYTKYEGGQSFRGFVNRTMAEAAQTLSADEKRAVQDIVRGREKVEGTIEIETQRKFVHNWQLDDLLPAIEEVKQGRSFENGKLAYRVAQCHKCHRMRGSGGATGPDLTGVGNRFSITYLLEAIVVPSKVIPEQYRNWQVATEDGEIITGRIVAEDEQQVTLRTHPYAPRNVRIAKRDVEERKLSSVSEMPQGLINTLSQEEILDLIAYLRSGGNETDAAFR